MSLVTVQVNNNVSDGIIELVKSGVINGRKKKRHPGKIVSSFLMGSRALYEFVDDNPEVAMLDVAYVNDTALTEIAHPYHREALDQAAFERFKV